MMNPILVITHLYLIPFLLAVLVAGDSPPLYHRVENIVVKCGFSGQLPNSSDGRTWIGDIHSKFTPIDHQSPTNTSTALSNSLTNDHVSYSTARLSHSAFTYTFNLTPGQKFIRFYFFASPYCPGFDRSKALFSVKAGGFTLLNDFNTSVTADNFTSDMIYREFCLNIDKNKPTLNITFAPNTTIPDAYAFINGIEIVSMPANLYYNKSKPVGGDDIYIQIEGNSALETVYRINSGGDDIFFSQDTTGMYRNWDGWHTELQLYLDNLTRENSRPLTNYTLRPNFSTITKYTAPEKVYQTARTMGVNDTENMSYNLTWVFRLDARFYYLVRLHFCEFESDVTENSDRPFSIFMDGQLAEEKADVIAWSGGNGRPVYKDYRIFMASNPYGRQKDVLLSLELQPNDQYSTYINAILNGIEIFKLNDTTSNLAGPNLDPPKDPPKHVPSCRNESKDVVGGSNKMSLMHLLAIVGGVVISISAFVVLGVLVFRRHRRVRKYKRTIHRAANSTKSRGSSTLPAELCYSFSLAEIKAATHNFDDICIIGHGGFGNVYKGYIDLDGAATPVAVKRLKPESSQGAHEFKTEIEMLSQLRHRHLVPLVGYCTEEAEMILVYEYMANGTLRDHLYNTDNLALSWEQRLEICIGTARGLQYLHSGVKYTIIHRDMKSTNILLDEKWVGRVSDFGLSKMRTTTMSNTHISTMVKGSFGYLDPEYYRRQQLTEKSDVYSFGVVLCEVLCARPAVIRTVEKWTKQASLAVWAKACYRNGKLDTIMDPILRGKIARHCFNKYAEIAMSCMNDNGTERPSMNDVVRGLEFALELQQQSGGEDMMNKDDNVILGKVESEIDFYTEDEEVGFGSSTTGKSSTAMTSESMMGDDNDDHHQHWSTFDSRFTFSF